MQTLAPPWSLGGKKMKMYLKTYLQTKQNSKELNDKMLMHPATKLTVTRLDMKKAEHLHPSIWQTCLPRATYVYHRPNSRSLHLNLLSCHCPVQKMTKVQLNCQEAKAKTNITAVRIQKLFRERKKEVVIKAWLQKLFHLIISTSILFYKNSTLHHK